jgi:hypothetical protein
MTTDIMSDGEEATRVYVVLSWAWRSRGGRGAEPSRAERCCGLWVSGVLCERPFYPSSHEVVSECEVCDVERGHVEGGNVSCT